MSIELKREVNETIIKSLQANQIPWRGLYGFPRNIQSRLKYDGVNVLLLNIASQQLDWSTAYWGTYDQWLKYNCNIKPRPSCLSFEQWCQKIVLYKPQFDSKMNQEVSRWTVFNLAQIATGFDDLRFPPKPLEDIDKVIKSTKADIHYENTLEAAYYYGKDYIIFPHKDNFKEIAAYYNSLAHELCGHWTENRLGFNFDTAGNELRAEICAEYFCTELGIPPLDFYMRTNHNNYLDDWIEIMRKDPDLIFKITASASKGVDYVMSFTKKVEPRHNPPS